MQHATDCQCSICEQMRKEQKVLPPTEAQPNRPAVVVVPPKKIKTVTELNDKLESYYSDLDNRIRNLEPQPKLKNVKRKKNMFKSWEFYLMTIGGGVFLYILYLVWMVVKHGKHISLPF